jgi:hypothetical protein
VPRKRPRPPIAHVYAPRFPHEPLEIIGSREGLEQLINAMIDGVSVGQGRGEICTNDGSDSEVRITCLEGARRSEEWLRSGSPYWDVDEPLVARLLDLTEENCRLRTVIATLRAERKSVAGVEYHGEPGAAPEGPLTAG